MPTAENSSAGKTFSMSRWAITFPMVARRSPASTTPESKVAATIVVPCGSSTAPLTAGSVRFPGSSSGESSPRKSRNDDEPGVRKAAGRRPVVLRVLASTRFLPHDHESRYGPYPRPGNPSAPRSSGRGAGGRGCGYSPPFWTKDRTKSSAFSSRTSSISSRTESTSSESFSWRSLSSSAALASCWTSSTSSVERDRPLLSAVGVLRSHVPHPARLRAYKIRPYKEGPTMALEYDNVRVLPG